MRIVAAASEFVPAWARWRQQTVARRFNPFALGSETELEEHLANFGCGLDPAHQKAGWFAVVDTTPVGFFAATMNWRMGTAAIGYHVDADVHGRGVGTRLVSLALEQVWACDRIRKVSATVHADNVPSHRLLRRLGFQLEGTLREEWRLDDVDIDVLVYGQLRRERVR